MLTHGKIQGIAIDYLTHIFNVNDINFKYISASEVTWPEALEYIKRHEVVDMVPTAKITNERKKDMIFTDEYIFAPWVIFTRVDSDFISSIDDLNGKTVSVEEGYVMHQRLRQDYPGIHLKVVSANLKNFAQIPVKELSTGLVDAYIGNLLSTTYTIQTKGYTNIKVAAPTPFDNHNQAMAIRSDWPELSGIINKTLASMTPEEHAVIRNKWLSIRYEYGINKIYVLKWVLGVIGIAFFIIGFILIWNKRLKTEVILRKKTETALKDSEKKYKVLFNNAQVALFRTGISDGKLIEINERYAKMAGYSTIGDCMAKFNSADAWADTSGRDKLVETLKKNGFVFDYETKIIRKDKSLIWISFSATIFSEKGYIEGSIVDITKRKQAEESLRESQSTLKAALESMTDAVFITDANGQFIEFNEACATFHRFKNKNECLKTFAEYPDVFEVYLPDGTLAPIKMWAVPRALRGETGINSEYTIHRKDTGKTWVGSYNLAPIRDKEGIVVGSVVVARDITEQKRMEEEKVKLEGQLLQAQKLESIGTLAGGIAHDFNNILYPIIGFTEMSIEDLPKDHPIQENLEDILKGTIRARDLVKQILSFSNQRDIEQKALPLTPLIKETLNLLKSIIPSNIIIEQILSQKDIHVFANATEIHEIIMNLCTNAYHAMEGKGGILKVALNKNQPGPDIIVPTENYCCLSISDTGAGISSEIIDNIFDPYFTTKEQGKGSGLGLSVIHGIVKSYKGAIEVQSKPGQGTVFNVFLPLTEKRDTQLFEIKDTASKLGNEHILFVDDEVSFVDVMNKRLTQRNIDVIPAHCGEEALNKLKEDNRVEVVVLDVKM
ncbi:MAG: transporter substrate-binding domain-containing protein, partial [Desulfobacula sp.]|nr:transporter substrate-binding domain-containing protein [Desulfobacula sp.]